MKRNWKSNIILMSLFFLLLLAAACRNGDHEEHADTYTCPMHPTVIQDKPGSCPVCGMALVKKVRAGDEVQIGEELSPLLKSPNETVIASIRTIKGEYKSVSLSVEAQGIVTYDTRNIYTIPARMGGRLEKVFLKYPFQHVRKGQKVAEIYSPEWLTAQRELVFLLENDANNEQVIAMAKERLRLLGANETQINDLITTRNVKSTFAIYSPYDGYVMAETQQIPAAVSRAASSSGSASGGMADGMSVTSGTSTESSVTVPAGGGEDLIREGAYAASGQTLFKVVNASALRVELNLPSARAAAVKKGSRVTLDFGSGHTALATVDFIQPFFNQGQEFVTVRVYTDKTEQLHIGHLVNAKIESTPVEGLWIPKEAVLDLGVDKVVFVKSKNVLKPRKISTGAGNGKEFEVKQGLSSSDEIAANAQYLVDSESFIKTQR